MLPRHFLTDRLPLTGGDAAAAIIIVPDGRYLLQLRDDISGIFYPGHWGCFGGAKSEGETALDCLRRELAEELDYTVGKCREILQFGWDLTTTEGAPIRLRRIYFEIVTTTEVIDKLRLGEGAAMKLLTAEEIFARANVTPYDSFALWLHFAHGRIK